MHSPFDCLSCVCVCVRADKDNARARFVRWTKEVYSFGGHRTDITASGVLYQSGPLRRTDRQTKTRQSFVIETHTRTTITHMERESHSMAQGHIQQRWCVCVCVELIDSDDGIRRSSQFEALHVKTDLESAFCLNSRYVVVRRAKVRLWAVRNNAGDTTIW